MVTTYEHDTKSMMDKVSRGTLPQGVVTWVEQFSPFEPLSSMNGWYEMKGDLVILMIIMGLLIEGILVGQNFPHSKSHKQISWSCNLYSPQQQALRSRRSPCRKS
jgi:hypothetical protein